VRRATSRHNEDNHELVPCQPMHGYFNQQSMKACIPSAASLIVLSEGVSVPSCPRPERPQLTALSDLGLITFAAGASLIEHRDG